MDFKKVLSYVPTVIESSSRGEKSFDIFSRLLRERIIFLGTEIDDDAFGSRNYNYELWSSTEYDEKDVWVLNFVDGLDSQTNSSADKDYSSHDVRPVLEF